MGIIKQPGTWKQLRREKQICQEGVWHWSRRFVFMPLDAAMQKTLLEWAPRYRGGRGVGVRGAGTEWGMGFSGPKLARLPTEPRCRAVLWMCVVPIGVVGLVPCCSPRPWAGPGGTLGMLDLGEVSASPWKGGGDKSVLCWSAKPRVRCGQVCGCAYTSLSCLRGPPWGWLGVDILCKPTWLRGAFCHALMRCIRVLSLSHKELRFHCPAFLSQQPTLRVLC